MHVHLIGVCGTGMGSLAGLLVAAGHRVTGSDAAFHPPMGPALKAWGVETLEGYSPDHLDARPDLVVVGNVCRPDHPEARAAIERGLPYASFPATLAKHFLEAREPFVVAGTHGKTTTSTLLAYLLDRAGAEPGMLVGGIPRDFDASFRLGVEGAPFVVEGDEYDSAFFEKTPKLWQYRARAAILTSVEHDHIDIYPDPVAYRAAFERFVEDMPEDGVLVAWAGSPEVRAVAARARCRVVFYALSTDDVGDASPTWVAAPIQPRGGMAPFELFIGGSATPTVISPMSGHHNVLNATAAMALAAETGRATVPQLLDALRSFRGVRRRQELLGVADGVRVYDDFAHHPTAVRETLRGLRARHPEGSLLAVFEPRSATASRRLHQEEYPSAFRSADVAILAPVGRPEIADGERLDVAAIAASIGDHALAPASHEAILEELLARARPGDTVVLMSNGAFGGLHDRTLAALARRAVGRPAPQN
ncbi:MAG: UDP-N-acetylmuramate:L-alanyl-gamma-D-glutamyl-meso-diaminopimelate ligase [Sandaracinaceae bacterium]|nr:UDP-N-acetylmuramate:L-alanyl-gamma-D-glutamyl-meso-diaminopimelate ligase [Sandaracinaceae bacterium]